MRTRSVSEQGRAVVVIAALLACGISASTSAVAAEDPSFGHPNRFISNDGAYLYRAICQGCHMADGKGATAAATYPALVGNPRMASGIYTAMIVVNGMKAMPALGDLLSDEQVAAVVNYVRSNFGNQAPDALRAVDVKAIRR